MKGNMRIRIGETLCCVLQEPPEEKKDNRWNRPWVRRNRAWQIESRNLKKLMIRRQPIPLTAYKNYVIYDCVFNKVCFSKMNHPSSPHLISRIFGIPIRKLEGNSWKHERRNHFNSYEALIDICCVLFHRRLYIYRGVIFLDQKYNTVL